MSFYKLANRFIQYSFYLLFFLVPLIMTPFNYELFEFNKMMLVYGLTVVIAAAWLSKMIVAKKVLFRRTPLDVPLILFFIFYFLSFIFSIDRHTSLWGYYGRFNGGLLSTISYITLYYAFVSNIHYPLSIINYLKIILASGFLVSTYGILEHFGIDDQYWVQDVRNRVFSTIGQPNWLAAYLAALSPLSWAFALNSKLKTQNSKLKTQNEKFRFFGFGNFNLSRITYHVSRISLFLSFLFYLCLLFTRSRSGFLGFGVAYLTFWGLAVLKERKRIFRPFLLFTFLFFILTFLIGTPFEKVNRYSTWKGLVSLQTRNNKYQIPDTIPGGTESGEIRKIVWQGAIDIWRHYPVFGSGVETFAYSYYQYRPKEHNLTSEWDFLYNKAHNEFLNYAATTGLVGLGSYLLLIGWFIAWNLKKLKTQNSNVKTTTQNSKLERFKILDLDLRFEILHFSLFSGWLSILLTNFFGFSVVPVALFFFLVPAMSFALAGRTLNDAELNADKRRNTTQQFSHLTIKPLDYFQKVTLAFVLLVTCYLLLIIGKLWLADVAYAKGRNLNQSGQYDAALGKLQASIRLNPDEPVYKDEIAASIAHLAFLAHQQEMEVLSDQLAQKAVGFNDQAIEISPYNLNFWKGRAKIFYTLSQIDKKYLQNALTALTTAHMLAPTDAKVAYNLGLVLGQVGQNDQAIEMLEQTIKLKPDYRNARYGLALFYRQAGFDQAAIGQLEYILDNIATDDGGVIRKLEEWKQ